MNEQQPTGVVAASTPDSATDRGMHHDVFGTDRRPFDDRADAAFTFRTPELDETFAAVEYEIRFGRSAVLVIGEAGLGKTQFVRAMLPRLSATDQAVVLTWPASGKRDVVREACKAFGVSVSSSRGSDSRRTSRLARHLARHHRDESRNVLFIDQAENLNANNLTQVMALTELESGGTKLLTIVLTAQPRLLEQFDKPEHARLKQCLFGERTLAPLTCAQTGGYIAHRLAQAGASDSPLFDADAVAWIHERTRGIPRLINHVCNQAMLAAYGADESRITASTLIAMDGGSIERERSMNVESLGLPTGATARPADTGDRVCVPSTDQTAGEADAASFEGDDRTDWSPDPDGGGEWPGGDAVQYAATSALAEQRDQDVLLDSMDSLFVRGEALLNRLERALARADRMAGSSESTIAQQQAIEKHLEALTERAERVIGGLKRAAPETMRSLSKVTQRVQAIDRACTNGERVETKLLSVARVIAEKADEVQDRVAQLMKEMASGQSLQAQLTEAKNQVSEATDACAVRTERMSALVKSADARVEQLDRALSDNPIETLTVKLREHTERAEDDVKALEQKIDACTEHAEHAAVDLEKRAAGVRQTLNKAGEEFTRFESTCRDRVLALCQSTIEDHRTAFQRALHEIADGAKQQVDAACERAASFVADTESRIGKLRSTCDASVTATEERVDMLAEKIPGIVAHTQDLQQTVTALEGHANATVKRLTTATHEGEAVIDRMNTDRGRSEELRRSLAAAVTEVDKASERVHAIREQALECQQIAARIAVETSAGEELVTRLSSATSVATTAHTEIEAAVHTSQDRTRRIDSHNAAASATLKELASATKEGRSAIDALRSMSETTAESLGKAQKQLNAFTAGEQDRAAAGRRLDLLVQAAHRLDASLRGTVEKAGEREEALTSTTARATATQEVVSELLGSGRDVIDRAERMARDAEQNAAETTEKVERLIQDVWSLTGKAESTTARLKADLATAEQLITSLSDGVVPARCVRDQLTDVTQRASAEAKKLTEREQRAEHLLEQVASLNETLEAARETQDGMGDLIEEARGLSIDLADTATDAQQHCLTLRELHQASGDLTREQSALNKRSDKVLKTLTARLETAQTFAQSSESLLHQFIERAEAIEQELTGFDREAQAIRSTFDKAGDVSERALQQAVDQSKKLARVGEAVRKVSAGLAQTTLEAQRHLSELKAANEESAARLSVLTSVSALTHRTTEAMQAWVNESITAEPKSTTATSEQTTERPLIVRERTTATARVVNRTPVGAPVDPDALSRLPSFGDNAGPKPADAVSPPNAARTNRQPVGATARSAAHAADIAKLIEASRQSAQETAKQPQ